MTIKSCDKANLSNWTRQFSRHLRARCRRHLQIFLHRGPVRQAVSVSWMSAVVQPRHNLSFPRQLRLSIHENTLIWGHLFPTAPDTLGCFPYIKTDPFVIEQCPHVYFAANQPEFCSKLVEGKSIRNLQRCVIIATAH